MKQLQILAQNRLAHSLLSASEFPIDKVKWNLIMLPTLPHLCEPVIRAVVSSHRI
jgi:hypothetical protein